MDWIQPTVFAAVLFSFSGATTKGLLWLGGPQALYNKGPSPVCSALSWLYYQQPTVSRACPRPGTVYSFPANSLFLLRPLFFCRYLQLGVKGELSRGMIGDSLPRSVFLIEELQHEKVFAMCRNIQLVLLN